jgi:hypothetical protein
MTKRDRSIFAANAVVPFQDDLGAEGIKPSAQLDTTGRNGGLGYFRDRTGRYSRLRGMQGGNLRHGHRGRILWGRSPDRRFTR